MNGTHEPPTVSWTPIDEPSDSVQYCSVREESAEVVSMQGHPSWLPAMLAMCSIKYYGRRGGVWGIGKVYYAVLTNCSLCLSQTSWLRRLIVCLFMCRVAGLGGAGVIFNPWFVSS